MVSHSILDNEDDFGGDFPGVGGILVVKEVLRVMRTIFFPPKRSIFHRNYRFRNKNFWRAIEKGRGKFVVMEGKLIERLEAAVVRLEALSASGVSREFLGDIGGEAVTDPSILAFDDLMSQRVARILAATEKIGGQVLDVTKILSDAFSVSLNY